VFREILRSGGLAHWVLQYVVGDPQTYRGGASPELSTSLGMPFSVDL